MIRSVIAAVVIAGAWAGAAGAQAASTERPDFSGSWMLNSDLSDHQEQVGFGPEASGTDSGQPRTGGPTGGSGGGGGFGRRGGGGRGGLGGGGFGGSGGSQAPRESTDDRLRTLELTDEVRNPSSTLTISQHDGTFSVSDAQNTTRVFHTNGKKDTLPLHAVKVDSKTVWDGDRLVTEYDVGSGRKIRYTYSIVPDSRQLLVEVVFDTGQKQSGRTLPAIKHIYDVASAPPQ
jgi:hypothetical protein